MKRSDVPFSPAYVVFHDAYDKGAMDVWPAKSFAEATERVTVANMKLDSMGEDGGNWRAYEKLPRLRVYKLHAPEAK